MKRYYTAEKAKAQFPNMIGSDKQIAYAASIRDESERLINPRLKRARESVDVHTTLLANASKMAEIAAARNITPSRVAEIARNTVENQQARADRLAGWLAQEKAEWWIDNRDEILVNLD